MERSQSPPRLTVELTREQYDALAILIPWGVKGQVFRLIVDDLIKLVRTNPDAVIGAILAKNISLENFPSFREK